MFTRRQIANPAPQSSLKLTEEEITTAQSLLEKIKTHNREEENMLELSKQVIKTGISVSEFINDKALSSFAKTYGSFNAQTIDGHRLSDAMNYVACNAITGVYFEIYKQRFSKKLVENEILELVEAISNISKVLGYSRAKEHFSSFQTLCMLLALQYAGPKSAEIRKQFKESTANAQEPLNSFFYASWCFAEARLNLNADQYSLYQEGIAALAKCQHPLKPDQKILENYLTEIKAKAIYHLENVLAKTGTGTTKRKEEFLTLAEALGSLDASIKKGEVWGTAGFPLQAINNYQQSFDALSEKLKEKPAEKLRYQSILLTSFITHLKNVGESERDAVCQALVTLWERHVKEKLSFSMETARASLREQGTAVCYQKLHAEVQLCLGADTDRALEAFPQVAEQINPKKEAFLSEWDKFVKEMNNEHGVFPAKPVEVVVSPPFQPARENDPLLLPFMNSAAQQRQAPQSSKCCTIL